jgi:RHS repeat-associated protein
VYTTTFPDNTWEKLTTSTITGIQTVTKSDGSVIVAEGTGDPRFGMAVPIAARVTATSPGGLATVMTTQRQAVLADPDLPLSLLTLTDTTTIGTGSDVKTTAVVYNRTAGTLTYNYPGGTTAITLLNDHAQPVRKESSGFSPITYTYDAHGRPLTQTIASGTPLAQVTQFSYGANGSIATLTDPLGRTAGWQYDPQGDISWERLLDGRIIQITYDSSGNLISYTPPGKPAYQWSYNPEDRPTSFNPPDLAGVMADETQSTYSLNRHTSQITYPGGLGTANFNYNLNGLISSFTSPDGTTLYGYDSAGRLSTIENANAGVTYTYDADLVTATAWSGTVNGGVSRVYDNFLQVVGVQVNTQPVISYSYNPSGLLEGAGNLSISRSPVSQLVSSSTLNQVSDNTTYDDLGRVLTYTAVCAGAPCYHVEYTYDLANRVTHKLVTTGGQTHTFDYLYATGGPLTEVRRDNLTLSTYSYDANNNRITSNGAAASFNARDQLVSYGTASFTYNAMGMLASRSAVGQTTTYQYDHNGNLLAVDLPGTANDLSFQVDGLDNRIAKRIGGTLVRGYLYDGLRLTAELDGSGALVSQFVYGLKSHVPDSMIRAGVEYRLVTDHLGSVRLVVRASDGQVIQAIDYDEWGKVLSDTNPGFQPFGFAGGLYDAETGLVHFGRRDYDPSIGRWTAPDPLEFGGGSPNLYEYCMSDPINWIDPAGMRVFAFGQTVTATAGFSGITGGWGVAIDTDWNVAWYLNAGSGGSTAFGSVSGGYQVTQLEGTLDNFAGTADNTGASGGEVLSIGGDRITSYNSDGSVAAHGTSLSLSAGLSTSPGEVHTFRTDTMVIKMPQFKYIKDTYNGVVSNMTSWYADQYSHQGVIYPNYEGHKIRKWNNNKGF